MALGVHRSDLVHVLLNLGAWRDNSDLEGSGGYFRVDRDLGSHQGFDCWIIRPQVPAGYISSPRVHVSLALAPSFSLLGYKDGP